MRSEMQARARDIGAGVGAEVLLDERLAPYCSMRVGGEAAAFMKPGDGEALTSIVRELHAQGVPYRVLGGGSNLLAADGPLPFVVVQATAAATAPVFEGARVRVSASLSLAALLRECLKRGLAGLEWAAGLPGSVGGAVVGNAGAFGGEMGPSVREVLLMNPDGTVQRHHAQQGDFSYRRSFVGPRQLVLEVVLELEPSDPDTVRAEFNRVNAQRAGSQPKGGHSSGCMFKNPPGDAAGRLIDSCGLKGLRHGGASVSERHANFIVNDGEATAADILAVMNDVRETVKRETGVDLEPEVRVWSAQPEGGTP